MPTDWGSTSAENARRASRNHENSRGVQSGGGCLIALVGTAAVVAVLYAARGASRRRSQLGKPESLKNRTRTCGDSAYRMLSRQRRTVSPHLIPTARRAAAAEIPRPADCSQPSMTTPA
ncbi:hypothetical protein GCM10027088_20200 [Nocardia goodfellowii]